jgi:hypothetical protein
MQMPARMLRPPARPRALPPDPTTARGTRARAAAACAPAARPAAPRPPARAQALAGLRQTLPTYPNKPCQSPPRGARAPGRRLMAMYAAPCARRHVSRCLPAVLKRANMPGGNWPHSQPQKPMTLASLNVAHMRTWAPNSLRGGGGRRRASGSAAALPAADAWGTLQRQTHHCRQAAGRAGQAAARLT